MQDILKVAPKPDPDSKVFNFLTSSETASFYDEFYGQQTVAKPENYEALKSAHSNEGSAYRIMEEIVSTLERMLPADAVVVELGGGMYQQRSANAYRRFKNYYPLDIGYSNIKKYTQKYDREGIVADATSLPFKDNSVDCILTHTFLEHPIEPDKVLREIVRVLKPGGIVVHNDAWFCRWWQRYGVVNLKKFSSLNAREKAIVIASKITELPFLRIPPILIRRLTRHFFTGKEQRRKLPYRKLKPNYSLHLGCDEDAASSLDPLDVILFYEASGFTLVHDLSFRQRIFHPNRYILLRKGASSK